MTPLSLVLHTGNDVSMALPSSIANERREKKEVWYLVVVIHHMHSDAPGVFIPAWKGLIWKVSWIGFFGWFREYIWGSERKQNVLEYYVQMVHSSVYSYLVIIPLSSFLSLSLSIYSLSQRHFSECFPLSSLSFRKSEQQRSRERKAQSDTVARSVKEATEPYSSENISVRCAVLKTFCPIYDYTRGWCAELNTAL